MAELIQKVRVLNQMGLHTRPATHIMRMTHRCRCDVILSSKKRTADAKDIMQILMLETRKNNEVTITIRGDNEDEAKRTMANLIEGFSNCFGEKF